MINFQPQTQIINGCKHNQKKYTWRCQSKTNKLKPVRVLAVFCAIFIGMQANAQMATFDATNAAKQIELFNQGKQQLEAVTKQLDFFADINKTAQDTLKQLGKLTKISVPFVNRKGFDQALAKNQSCLMPNFKDLIPNFSTTNAKIPDLCGGRNLYRDNYFIKNKQDYERLPNKEKEVIKEKIKEKRNNLNKDTLEKALAQGDLALQQTTDFQSAINELETASDDATDLASHLAVIAKIGLLNARAQNQTNQILSSLLKLQATNNLSGLAADEIASETATK